MWRRSTSKALRLGCVMGMLVFLYLTGFITPIDDFEGGRILSSADFDLNNFSCSLPYYATFCGGNCTNPDGFPYACCNNHTGECLTYDGDVCPQSWLVVADLLPGGAGEALCLAAWEKNAGGAILYLTILLYIFLGLAIICDDYFVVALEKISDGLGLSADVAGATFMAAGSSAPEFFVSLADNVISNPPKSVGVGTIVGSAIFNILVIIGMSALMAGQALYLDWRPLTRDVTFYVIAITALILFTYDGYVHWWEGLILLFLYSCYILTMVFNEKLFRLFDRLSGDDKRKAELAKASEPLTPVPGKNNEISFRGDNTVVGVHDVVPVTMDDPVVSAAKRVLRGSSSESPSMRHTLETSRPTVAIQVASEIDTIQFKHHDSESAIAKLEEHSATTSTTQNTGRWKVPKNKSGWGVGTSFRTSNRSLLADETLPMPRTSQRGPRALSSAALRASEGFSSSMEAKPDTSRNAEDVEAAKDAESEPEEDQEGYWAALSWPMEEHGCCGDWGLLWKARLWCILCYPFNVLFRFTVPDCSYDIFREDREGIAENRRIGYWTSFTMCIVWIAVLSQILVYAGAKFGYIVGLSPAVMGLTILAAGTSVPDAISSIIVARQGEGDMAVANSIGSNVFDILMGLGFPWLIAPWIYGQPTLVLIDDIWIGIGFLFGVVACLVGLLLFFKWRLSKRVGVVLVFLYFLYVIFELFVHPVLV